MRIWTAALLSLLTALPSAAVRSEERPAAREFHIPDRGSFRVTAKIWAPVDGMKAETIEDVLALRTKLVAQTPDKTAFEKSAFLEPLAMKELPREGPARPDGGRMTPCDEIRIDFDALRYSMKRGVDRMVATSQADTRWRDVTEAQMRLGERRQIDHYDSGECSYLRPDVGYWFLRGFASLEREWTLDREIPEGRLYRSESESDIPMTFLALAHPTEDEILAHAFFVGERQTLNGFVLFAGRLPESLNHPFVVPRIVLRLERRGTTAGKPGWMASSAYVHEADFVGDPDAEAFTCRLRPGDLYVAHGETTKARKVETLTLEIASTKPADVVAILKNPAN